ESNLDDRSDSGDLRREDHSHGRPGRQAGRTGAGGVWAGHVGPGSVDYVKATLANHKYDPSSWLSALSVPCGELRELKELWQLAPDSRSLHLEVHDVPGPVDLPLAAVEDRDALPAHHAPAAGCAAHQRSILIDTDKHNAGGRRGEDMAEQLIADKLPGA